MAPHLDRGVRMGARWAAPRVSAATGQFMDASYAVRDYVRRLAEENYEPLTETEYREATGDIQQADKTEAKLIEIGDEEVEAIVAPMDNDSKGCETVLECRKINLCCQTIRASRKMLQTEAFAGPLPLLSHWCVEVTYMHQPQGCHFFADSLFR